MSRAKVQTSVTSATTTGSPSTTSPALVARRRDELRDEAHGDLRRAGADGRVGDLGLVDADEAELDALALLLAIGDRAGEAVEHLAAEQRLQRLAVALREGGDDHLIGGAGAVEELGRIEAAVGGGDGGEPGGQLRAGGRIGGDALGSRIGGGDHRAVLGTARQRNDLVTGPDFGRLGVDRLAATRRVVAAPAERIEGRPLVAGPLAQDAPELPEDHDSQDEKDQCIDVHENRSCRRRPTPRCAAGLERQHAPDGLSGIDRRRSKGNRVRKPRPFKTGTQPDCQGPRVRSAPRRSPLACITGSEVLASRWKEPAGAAVPRSRKHPRSWPILPPTAPRTRASRTSPS